MIWNDQCSKSQYNSSSNERGNCGGNSDTACVCICVPVANLSAFVATCLTSKVE